jgi:hypothetical protein
MARSEMSCFTLLVTPEVASAVILKLRKPLARSHFMSLWLLILKNHYLLGAEIRHEKYD